MTTAVEPRECTAEARGLTFHWVEWGEPSADPIVLLHGLGAMCRIWDPLARALQDRYHLLALDQRGHGDTSWPVEPEYATEDYVADLEGLVRHWGLERFTFIGLSMGGMNAMAYTARHPDQIARLGIVDIRPAVDTSKRPNRDADQRTAEGGHPVFPGHEAAFVARKLTHPYTPDDSVRHHVQHLLRPLPDGQWTFKHDPRVSYYWRASNLWSELPGIEAPVLIVRGGQSLVLPQKTADDMLAAFPDARLVTIERAGHTVPEDCPEEFIAAVEAFLSETAA